MAARFALGSPIQAADVASATRPLYHDVLVVDEPGVLYFPKGTPPGAAVDVVDLVGQTGNAPTIAYRFTALDGSDVARLLYFTNVAAALIVYVTQRVVQKLAAGGDAPGLVLPAPAPFGFVRVVATATAAPLFPHWHGFLPTAPAAGDTVRLDLWGLLVTIGPGAAPPPAPPAPAPTQPAPAPAPSPSGLLREACAYRREQVEQRLAALEAALADERELAAALQDTEAALARTDALLADEAGYAATFARAQAVRDALAAVVPANARLLSENAVLFEKVCSAQARAVEALLAGTRKAVADAAAVLDSFAATVGVDAGSVYLPPTCHPTTAPATTPTA